MIAWSNSAPSAGTGMPNARKHTANPAALTSHNTNDHATTPANRPGRRSTSSPPINPSASRTSRSASRAGSTPWVILLKKESQGAGRCTTARATSRAAPNTIAPPPATRLTDVPPITASRGKDGAAIASAISPTITNPSITRSTPMEAKAVVKRTGSCRLATYARANSPARAGSRLLAMKPVAVACHSGRSGRRVSSPARSISCQRQVRIGKVAVMRTTLASNSHGSAWRACVKTSRGLTSCSVQTSRATETARPMSPAQRVARLLAGRAGFDREGNEVADFFDEGAQALARGRTGFLAQLLGALLGALATLEQGEDVHDVGFRRDAPAGGGGTGWPCGVRRGRRGRDLAGCGDHFGEGSGADPTGHQPGVGHPGADEVRRFGDRCVAGWSGARWSRGGGERLDGHDCAAAQGQDGAGGGLELRRQRGLIRSRRAAEDVARAPQLRGERGRVRDGGAAGHGVAAGGGECGHLVGERAATCCRQGAKRPAERVRAQLALRPARRALQRVRHLLQVVAVTHQLHAAQDRRARGGGAALHDVRPRIVEVQCADGHDAGFALIRLEELDLQAGERLELHALGVGAAALGDLARRARDGGRGPL